MGVSRRLGAAGGLSASARAGKLPVAPYWDGSKRGALQVRVNQKEDQGYNPASGTGKHVWCPPIYSIYWRESAGFTVEYAISVLIEHPVVVRWWSEVAQLGTLG